MIKLVVFDVAGTTVQDPDGVGGALKAALWRESLAIDSAEINAVMGIPKPLAIQTLMASHGTGTPSPQTVERIFRDFQERMKTFYREDPRVREVDGATEAFRRLHSMGILVGLDTGFDRSILTVVLSRVGWGTDLIDATATSDEVERGRPYPDLINRLMSLTGVDDPSSVAKVGDTPSDLQQGTAAGCSVVVGVTYGTHTSEQLAIHPHTHLVASIHEIPDLLASQNK